MSVNQDCGGSRKDVAFHRLLRGRIIFLDLHLRNLLCCNILQMKQWAKILLLVMLFSMLKIANLLISGKDGKQKKSSSI